MNKQLSDTTIKHYGGPLAIAENEIEIARKKFLAAYDLYIAQKTTINRNAMYAAWNELKRIKAQYRDGRKTLIAFAMRTQRRAR